jgi:hypothetical protein
LIAVSEINYIKHCTDRNYVHKRISGLRLTLTNASRVFVYNRTSEYMFWP